MKKSFALLLLISFVLALALIGLSQKEKQNQTNGKVVLVIKSLAKTDKESYDKAGITSLALLLKEHNVELTAGKFIKCIDGVCAENEYSWHYYINNKPINYGADAYKIKKGDEIIFEFSKDMQVR